MVWCSVVRIQGYDGRAALDENYLHIKLSAHDTPPPSPLHCDAETWENENYSLG